MQSGRALGRVVAIITIALAASSFPAQAGMTVYGLRDVVRLRLEEISFFCALLIACSFAFQLLWNFGFKGFGAVPRLSFRHALCLALLFGLVMLLILTMISGIREVLTPGAWRKQGTSYRLNDPSQEPARRRSLEYLRGALFEYARTHDGRFPAHDFVPELSEKLWESPDQLGSHYVYSGGLATNDVGAVLAVEPPNFGDQRFVLLTSGDIKMLSDAEIRNQFPRKAKHE
jgi:hypothetical protein